MPRSSKTQQMTDKTKVLALVEDYNKLKNLVGGNAPTCSTQTVVQIEMDMDGEKRIVNSSTMELLIKDLLSGIEAENNSLGLNLDY